MRRVHFVDAQNLWRCLLVVMNNGMRLGGGIGDITNQHREGEDFLLYDFLIPFFFYLFLNIAMLNLVLGPLPPLRLVCLFAQRVHQCELPLSAFCCHTHRRHHPGHIWRTAPRQDGQSERPGKRVLHLRHDPGGMPASLAIQCSTILFRSICLTHTHTPHTPLPCHLFSWRLRPPGCQL